MLARAQPLGIEYSQGSTATQTSSHPTNGRRLIHRLLYQMLCL